MCVAIALALLAGAVSPTVDVAGAVLPAYATTLLFFSGRNRMPWGEKAAAWPGCSRASNAYVLLPGLGQVAQ